MKIEKYIKKGQDKYQLYLDNGEVLDTYEDVILKHELLIKKEINNNTYNDILFDNQIEKNYIETLKYIKIRLRSKKEIESYLINKKIDNEIINHVITKLEKNQYINDDYYTKCFINDKMRLTSMGDYKIKSELKRVGISDNLIDKYTYLLSDELIDEKMNKLISKYIKASKTKSKEVIKSKIYTNLMNQGYDKDKIIHAINNLNNEE